MFEKIDLDYQENRYVHKGDLRVAFTKILLLGQIHVDITDKLTHKESKDLYLQTHTIQDNIHVHIEAVT